MRAAFLLALAVLAGCGDDDGGGGGGKPAAKAAKKPAAKDSKKAAKLEVITYIPTLEKVVAADEAPTIRRRLKDRDFQPDLTGTENRNPFQSFTMPQVPPDEGTAPLGPAAPPKPTDLCTRNKMVASGYPLKDLNLIGIVRRGAQYFALFRDAKGVGHVVERGKCIGREKALVTAIGDGLVTIERIPEVAPGGAEPVPVTETIPLYQTEITTDDFDEEEAPPPEEPAASGTIPAPPPISPPPIESTAPPTTPSPGN